MPTPAQRALFDRFRRDFLGLGLTEDVRSFAGGTTPRRRVYLDATATSLMPRPVWTAVTEYLETACANSHTHAHAAGRATTAAIEHARELVGRFAGYDPEKDVVIFTGNGATGAVNLLAQALFPAGTKQLLRQLADDARLREAAAPLVALLGPAEKRDVVVVTKMEHHSNMLPWLRAVGHGRVRFVDVTADGTLDLGCLERILATEGERAAVVALTYVSNVTGIINPVHDVARMAHAVGARVVVDAAQAGPHVPIAMHRGEPAEHLDYVVISGHKLYAPGSRGVLVGRRDTFEGTEVVGMVGGGAVDFVSTEEVRFKAEVSAREEAGTPNITGTIALGVVVRLLLEIGMDTVREHEVELVGDALARLGRIPDVVVYGATDTVRVPRAGVIAFNLRSLPHGLVAAALSDYFNVAVRNDCFCAQPYVKEQLQSTPDIESACIDDVGACDVVRRPGMVRASFGVFTTVEDLDVLEEGLRFLVANAGEIRERYVKNDAGEWIHRGPPQPEVFTIDRSVERWIANM
jgi:cysteine desulfurase / selenocysteine lyase